VRGSLESVVPRDVVGEGVPNVHDWLAWRISDSRSGAHHAAHQLLPLLFVLCVTAIKDAWDDWVLPDQPPLLRVARCQFITNTRQCATWVGSFSQNRRKADNEVNNRTAVVSERDFVRGSLTWRNVAYKVHLPPSFPNK
jgi:hypothetical protein